MTSKDIINDMRRYLEFMHSQGKTPECIWLTLKQVSKLDSAGYRTDAFMGIPIRKTKEALDIDETA